MQDKAAGGVRRGDGGAASITSGVAYADEMRQGRQGVVAGRLEPDGQEHLVTAVELRIGAMLHSFWSPCSPDK